MPITSTLSPADVQMALDRLFQFTMPLVVICKGLEVPPYLIRRANECAVPVMRTPQSTIATCCTVPVGAALRLSVQASAWPAFAINPGTGADPERTPLMEATVTTLRIAHGPDRPSRLLLPAMT